MRSHSGADELTDFQGTTFEIDNYLVSWRDRNWVVEKAIIRKKRNSNEVYTDLELVGYYQTLQNAAIRLFQEELRGGGQVNMKGLAELVQYAEYNIIKKISEALDRIDERLLKLPQEQRNEALPKVEEAIGKNPRQRRVNTSTGEIKHGG